MVRLADGADEAEVVRGLAERGVLVRAGAALGREGCLRVTYGTPARERALPGRAAASCCRRPAAWRAAERLLQSLRAMSTSRRLFTSHAAAGFSGATSRDGYACVPAWRFS